MAPVKGTAFNARVLLRLSAKGKVWPVRAFLTVTLALAAAAKLTSVNIDDWFFGVSAIGKDG